MSDPRAETAQPEGPAPVTPARPPAAWLGPPVRGIGAASLLADLGHEVPTALLPGLLTGALGAPAAALGVIEGVADGLAGAARLVGGGLAEDPGRRRATAVGGYTGTALLSGLIGAAGSAWQVGLLRAAAWTARGLRVPSRNALLADAVPPEAYGRAYGFERAMDNLGAIAGPLLAIGLVAVFGVRTAILLSTIPGLMAPLTILYAVRHLPRLTARERRPIRVRVRPVLRGRLGALMLAVSAFELGNIAVTLLILRASELLAPSRGADGATRIALLLYAGYNLAATLMSFPGGHLGDRRGTVRVMTGGAVVFVAAYLVLAATGPSIGPLIAGFLLAGIGIGCVETAEHAAVASLAPADLRGSAFGLLAAVQSFGNLAASAAAGALWTLVSAPAAFLYAAGWMVVAAALFVAVRR